MKDHFVIDDCLGFIANKLVRVFQKSLDKKLVEFNLTSAQFCVLAKLLEEEGFTQTELATRLYLESPTLVRTLDRMEANGIIERRRSPEDRRAYQIYLTPKGQNMRNLIDTVGTEIHNDAISGLGQEEVAILRGALRHIWKNLED